MKRTEGNGGRVNPGRAFLQTGRTPMSKITGGITGNAREFVNNRFRGRQRDCLILIAVFGLLGSLLIATSASNVDHALAVYLAGNTSLQVAAVWVIGWGAASGHGNMCECTAAGQERLHSDITQQLTELNQRLDRLAKLDLETANFLREGLTDELARRREHN